MVIRPVKRIDLRKIRLAEQTEVQPGDVMSDINGRRGMVLGMETEKNFTTLKALVPLKEMSSYSTTLSSLTGGRATFTMKFKSYELVPGDVQDKLIKEYEATQKDED